MDSEQNGFKPEDLRRGKRVQLFGLDTDQLIQSFFGGNALVAIMVLVAITLFLFKEGVGFWGTDGFFEQNHESLVEYRLSGQEYVDVAVQQFDDYKALVRYLNAIRTELMEEAERQAAREGVPEDQVFQYTRDATAAENQYINEFAALGRPLRSWLDENREIAVAIKEDYEIYRNQLVQVENWETTLKKSEKIALDFIDAQLFEDLREQAFDYMVSAERNLETLEFLEREIKESLNADKKELRQKADERKLDLIKTFAPESIPAEPSEDFIQGAFYAYENAHAQVKLDRLNPKEPEFKKRVQPILDSYPQYIAATDEMAEGIRAKTQEVPAVQDEELAERMVRFQELAVQYVESFPEYRQKMEKWEQTEPVGMGRSIANFFLGKDWVTNSTWHDWYGILPLLSGSLLICFIALTIAIPFGVGGAIYANQIAHPKELSIIKPYIEFIEALPSVVIGFFGIVVFGDFLREASGWGWLDWVPFFPLRERLNAFTAGCLLALMAIPTIFSLAEDAINNVPKAFKEASLAMGATRLQTTMRIIVPSSLSGIISAVLLGFGRVIGETMVVLLVAGNRIEIPNFFADFPGVLFEPVHTMTGIVAQEMGEVVKGSIHYRALFMVGIVLFTISLFINWLAQKIVRKYQIKGN